MTHNQAEVPLSHADFVSSSLAALRSVVARGNAIDVRAAESDKSEAAHESMLQAIAPLLDEAHEIMGAIGSRFDGDELDPSHTEVADVAALARMALQERRALLTHAQPCDHWSFLENCERSLRNLAKSAAVLEGALLRFQDLPPRLDRSGELTTALAVRRRYATLRREVTRAARSHAGVTERLQSVSKAMAALLACSEYPSMRLGDRREIRMLQFRIQTWLSTDHASDVAGERIWQEAISVVSLISNISNRSELTMHDGAILTALIDAVRRREDVRVLREIGDPLFGFDPDLDHLLDLQSAEGTRPEVWKRVVVRLAVERRISSTYTSELPLDFQEQGESNGNDQRRTTEAGGN